eukprot:CAMPEP_0197943996 /NCGR_PEP_ID=MMETSP1439-20131203/125190_1 /TAXON_ID=66791 /ORGANISM="Gonyaulax spinifera, Strain CCMP409" /LENGTH=605 /DNA_ID=CAMNT_0043567251 /DNA_START=86 /DNA_END=1903 /DNA_ORIENTATION=+
MTSPQMVLCLFALMVAVAAAEPSVASRGFDDEALLAELSRATGVSMGADLPEIKAHLQPMIATLPTSDGGGLGPVAVRYALHRFLLQRHGWLVIGLDPAGRSFNASWPSRVALLAKLPASARSLLEARLADPGLGLWGVAGLASLLEGLARVEAAERLRVVLKVMGRPETRMQENISMAEGVMSLQIYASGLILGRHPAKLTRMEVLSDSISMDEVYPNWPNVRHTLHNLLLADQPHTGGLDFAALARVAGVVGERLAEWQTGEYESMKKQLLKLEDRGSGRVRLADFYGQSLHGGTWQLSESLPYLRELGALDESKAGHARVIIPNYLMGPSNCIANTASLAVCDRSECEAVLGHLERAIGAPEASPQEIVRVIIPNYLMGSSNCIASTASLAVCDRGKCEAVLGHLERAIGAPEASPQEIVALVSNLPTATVPSNRTISLVMRHRLNNMAASSGGKVALHGRLFAQWLHHAYPRECPFPHLSGTTKPQQTNDWLTSTGTDYIASQQDMASHAGSSPESLQRRGYPGPVETAPWSYKEELFVPRPLAAEGAPTAWVALHGMVFAAAAAVSAFGMLLAKTARSARRAVGAAKVEQHPGKTKPYLV